MAEFHYDQNAEESVIGSMLEDNKVIPICAGMLTAESFLFTPHKILFSACVELSNSGKPVDAITIADRLGEADLNRVGGIQFIFNLVEQTPSAANAEYYAEIVQSGLVRRQLDVSAKQILSLTQEEFDIEVTKAKAQELILKVGADVSSYERLPITDQVNNAYERLLGVKRGEHVEISTGFSQFDELTGGLHRKEFFILAGLPTIGKSAFIHNVLYNVAVKDNLPAVLFCYESNHVQVLLRMVAAQSGIDVQSNSQEALSDSVMEVLVKLKHSNLIIEDSCPRSIEYATSHCRRLKLEHPELAVAVFDHVHLMTADIGRYDNRESEVSKIADGLKDLAKSLNIATVGLSQLSRASIRRQEKRPMLDDLRASGTLEANADGVAFVYREDYYEALTDSPISSTELITRKNRNGPVGTTDFAYNRALSRFTEG